MLSMRARRSNKHVRQHLEDLRGDVALRNSGSYFIFFEVERCKAFTLLNGL
jgi:hypothetical protein